MVGSGYSFVAVEVKDWKHNKILNVRALGEPVSFFFLSSRDVSLDFVSENIRTLGKTKLTGFLRDLTLSVYLKGLINA